MSDYNLGTASGRIEVDGRGAALGFKVAENAAGAMFAVIDQKVRSIQTLGRRMAAVGTAGTLSIAGSIKVAADFQQQMSGVNAVVNGTEEQMESLRQKAMQLGADTVFSASEAANAIEELAKAGIPVEDILNGAADAAVALAAAGGISIPEAATIAANAMNQFSLSAAKVPEVADILAGVANTSAADVSGLGQSLSQAGAVANLAGLSFKDTAIALGEMADAGIVGSDAGTSVKTMLNNLIPTTQTQTNKFKELGLLTYDLAGANKALQSQGLKTADSMDEAQGRLAKYMEELGKGSKASWENEKAVNALLSEYGGLNNQFFDAKGNIKDLEGLQGALAQGLKGMTREQKLQNLELLFGADAMRASAILSLAGAKGYREFASAVDKTKASDVAAKRLDNLNGAVEAFKGSMETAMISIGSVFLPIVTKIVQGVTWMVNAFNALPGPIKTIIAVLMAISSAGLLVIGMILAMLPLIVGWIANMLLMRSVSIVVSALKVLWTSLRTGQGVMAASRAAALVTSNGFMTMGKRSLFAAGLLTKAAKLMRAAWLIATGPIGIVIAAVAAVVALGVMLYKKWEPFRNLVDSIAASLKGAFVQAWAAILPLLKQAWEAIKQFGDYLVDTLGPVVQQVASAIGSALGAAWGEISGAIQDDLMPALRELAAVFQGEILPALQDLWTAVQPVVKVVGTVLVAAFMILIRVLGMIGKILISYVLPILLKVFGGYVLTAIKVLTAAIVGIIGVVSAIVRALTGFVQIIKGIFTGDWSQVWEGVKNVVGGALDFMVAIFKTIGKIIVAVFTGIWKMLPGPVQDFLATIGGAIKTAFMAIVNFFQAAWGIIKTIFFGYLNAIKAVWNAVWGTFGPLIKAVFGLIAAIINLGWQIIKGLFMTALRGLMFIVTSVFNGIKRIISTVMNALMPIIGPIVRAVKAVVTTAWNVIRNVTSTVWNAIKSAISAAWGAISGQVSGAIARVKSVITAAWNYIKGATTAAWNFLVSTIGQKVLDAYNKAMELKDKVTGFFADAISWLFDAGANLIQGLIDGITSKVEDVTNAVSGVADGVKGFFGGSPVEEGPLLSWNHGGAGKNIIGLLVKGIHDSARIAQKSAAVAADAVNRGFNDNIALNPAIATMAGSVGVGTTAGISTGRLPRAKVRTKTDKNARMRLVEGRLYLDRSGKAYIRGVAEEVVDEDKSYAGRRNRTKKGD